MKIPKISGNVIPPAAAKRPHNTPEKIAARKAAQGNKPRVPQADAAKAKKILGRKATVGGITHDERMKKIRSLLPERQKQAMAIHREAKQEDLKTFGPKSYQKKKKGC